MQPHQKLRFTLELLTQFLVAKECFLERDGGHYAAHL